MINISYFYDLLESMKRLSTCEFLFCAHAGTRSFTRPMLILACVTGVVHGVYLYQCYKLHKNDN